VDGGQSADRVLWLWNKREEARIQSGKQARQRDNGGDNKRALLMLESTSRADSPAVSQAVTSYYANNAPTRTKPELVSA
jgi:hypothetical protein